MREIIYTADSQLRTPRVFWQEFVRDLTATREIGWHLFLRNLRSQYRQSWLGYSWLIIPPLGTTLIWIYLSQAKVVNVAATNVPYPVFILTGVFLWQTFIEALLCPLQQIQSSRWILSRVKVPHEAFVLAGLGGVIFNLAARMLILLAAFFLYGILPQTSWLLFPLGVLSLLLFGLAIGCLITPLGVLYADVLNGVNIFSTFWFFITPIVYSNGDLAVIKYNPITPLLVTTRGWLLNGTLAPENGFILVMILSLGFFVLSWILYRLARPHLLARMTG